MDPDTGGPKTYGSGSRSATPEKIGVSFWENIAPIHNARDVI
jgi:hypothetical protein